MPLATSILDDARACPLGADVGFDFGDLIAEDVAYILSAVDQAHNGHTTTEHEHKKHLSQMVLEQTEGRLQQIQILTISCRTMVSPTRRDVELPSAEGNTEHRSSYHHRAGCTLEELCDFFAALLLLRHSFQRLDVVLRPQNASRFLLRHESSVYKEGPFTNRSTSGQGTFTAGI